MKDKWINPKIIIGAVAEGNFYYPRPKISEEIWEEINKGNHILISAPRRVGKTSITKYIEENPKEGYEVIFENIQGINSEKEFYKNIYNLLLSKLGKIEKFKAWISNYFKNKNLEEIDIKGKIKFKNNEIDYLNEINSEIIPNLDNFRVTVVIILDELPDMLHVIDKNGKKEEAEGILKNLRSWTQEIKFSNIKLIISGSIGIHHIVQNITGRIADINSLYPVKFPPLSRKEASEYIDWATKTATVKYDETLKNYLLDKIQYFIPYYLNILLDETNKIASRNENPKISTNDIDNAFDNAIKNNQSFEDYQHRLKTYFKKNDYDFMNKILTYTAHNMEISIQTIYNYAKKYKIINEYMNLINELLKDGYIVELEENKYSFISPLLQAFWKRNNPVLI